MKINVYSCLNDGRLHKHSLYNHPNIQHVSIRAIHDTPFFNQSIVLLSNHSTNFQVIRYVRRQNILTPIYIISNFQIEHKEINGVIQWKNLRYDYLVQKLMMFPQKTIWNHVFQLDDKNREQFMTRSQLIA